MSLTTKEQAKLARDLAFKGVQKADVELSIQAIGLPIEFFDRSGSDVDFYRDAIKRLNSKGLIEEWLLELKEDGISGDWLDVVKHNPVVSKKTKISLSKLPITEKFFFGRKSDLNRITSSYNSEKINLLSIVAPGGVGKSALINHWLKTNKENISSMNYVYGWSFYSQGTNNKITSANLFTKQILKWLGFHIDNDSYEDQIEKLVDFFRERPSLIILDGLEPLQYPPGEEEEEGTLKDRLFSSFLREIAIENPGLCIVTTRVAIKDLQHYDGMGFEQMELKNFSSTESLSFLESRNIVGSEDNLELAAEKLNGHSFSLTLLANYLEDTSSSRLKSKKQINNFIKDSRLGPRAKKTVLNYEKWLRKEQLEFLRLLGFFDRPTNIEFVYRLLEEPIINKLTENIVGMKGDDLQATISSLKRLGLVWEDKNADTILIDSHPLTREFFGYDIKEKNSDGWQEGYGRLIKLLKLKIIKGIPLGQNLGHAAIELQELYDQVRGMAEMLDHSLVLFNVLWAQWACYQMRAERTLSESFSKYLFQVAEKSKNELLLSEAYQVVANVEYYLKDNLVSSIDNWNKSINIYQKRDKKSKIDSQWPTDTCVNSLASISIAQCLLGDIGTAMDNSKKAIKLAKEINDPFSEVVSLVYAAQLNQLIGKNDKVAELSRDAISKGANFSTWLAAAKILNVVSTGQKDTSDKIIEYISDWKQSKSKLLLPYFYCLLAVAYSKESVDSINKGLNVVKATKELIEETGERAHLSDLYRVEGLLKWKKNADLNEIENCFLEAINIAKKQKAKSLELRHSLELSNFLIDNNREKEACTLIQPLVKSHPQFEYPDFIEAKKILQCYGV